MATASTIDFTLAKTKHLVWKTKLRSFLDGKESLSEAQVVSHTDCDLGKWLHFEGIRTYGTIPEMRELEKTHIELHAVVKKVVQLKKQGNTVQAEAELRKVEPISQRIIALLNTIEQKIK